MADNTSQEKPVEKPKKKPWVKPEIRQLGCLQDVTQGGDRFRRGEGPGISF